MSDIAPDADSLVDLLEHQRDLADRLEVLAERQRGLIASGDSGLLLSLLADRQEIMDELTAGQDRLRELAEATAAPGAVAPGGRQRIQGLIDAIAARLNDVVRRDETDRVALEHLRDQTRESIEELGTARKAQRAYAPARSGRSRYADRQG